MNTAFEPVKRKRALKACDFCHHRGRRCGQASTDDPRCPTCIEFGVSCTWNRVSLKRGARPRSLKVTHYPWTLSDAKHGSRETILALLDNFFESVYPMLVVL